MAGAVLRAVRRASAPTRRRVASFYPQPMLFLKRMELESLRSRQKLLASILRLSVAEEAPS